MVDDLSNNVQSFMQNVSALERMINRQQGSTLNYKAVQDIAQLSTDTANLAKLTQESVTKLRKGSIYGQLSQGDRMKLDRNAMQFKSTLSKFHNLHATAMDLQEQQVQQTQAAQRPRFGSAAGSVTSRASNPFGEDEEDDLKPLMGGRRQPTESEMLEVMQLEDQAMQLEERHQSMRQLQTDMVDLNQIMRDMATIVVEQGDTIDVIEDNVDNAANSVEKGTKSLQRASKYKKCSRRLACVIAIIVVVVVIVLLIIIVVVLKVTGVLDAIANQTNKNNSSN